MFDFTGLKDAPGWMREAGQDDRVVISSRVRLSRNLAGHLYPGTYSPEEEGAVRSEILEAFKRLPNAKKFSIIYLDDISPLERRMLFERNVISQAYSLEKNKAIVLAEDESRSAVIADEDHLRLVGVKTGAGLEAVFEGLNAVDDALNRTLGFAVSGEWGYLNTAITNLGTGLKASMMLHLPALSMSGLIKRAVKASAQLGLSIRGFFSESVESLGDIYIVANEVTIGLSEKEIIGNLGRIAAQLIGYEIRARDELMEKRRMDIEDRVFRAQGLLTHCRYLSAREAVENLSSLKLGVCMGLVTGVDNADVASLLFLCQKSHIQKLLQSRHDTVDSKLIDYTRAKLIRDSLAVGGGEGHRHV
jgi:protein arginine kinase